MFIANVLAASVTWGGESSSILPILLPLYLMTENPVSYDLSPFPPELTDSRNQPAGVRWNKASDNQGKFLPPLAFQNKNLPGNLLIQTIQASAFNWHEAGISKLGKWLPATLPGSNAVAIPFYLRDKQRDKIPAWLVMTDHYVGVHPATKNDIDHFAYPDSEFIPWVDEIILDRNNVYSTRSPNRLSETEPNRERLTAKSFQEQFCSYHSCVIYLSNTTWYVAIKINSELIIFPIPPILNKYFLSYSGELPVYRAGRSASDKNTSKAPVEIKSSGLQKSKQPVCRTIDQKKGGRVRKPNRLKPTGFTRRGEKPPCPVCGQMFKVKYRENWLVRMREHIATSHKKLATKCPTRDCQSIFIDNETFVKHVKEQKRKCSAPAQCSNEFCHLPIAAEKSRQIHEEDRCTGRHLPKQLSVIHQKAFDLVMSRYKIINSQVSGTKEKIYCTLCHSPSKIQSHTPRMMLQHLANCHRSIGFPCSTIGCLYILDSVDCWSEHVKKIRSLAKELELHYHEENTDCHFISMSYTSLYTHKVRCDAGPPTALFSISCRVYSCPYTCETAEALKSHCKEIQDKNNPDERFEYVCSDDYCHWSLTKVSAMKRNQGGRQVTEHIVEHQTRATKKEDFSLASHYLPRLFWDMTVFNNALQLLSHPEMAQVNSIFHLSGAVQLQLCIDPISTTADDQPSAPEAEEVIIELRCSSDEQEKLEQEVIILGIEPGTGSFFDPQQSGKALVVMKSYIHGQGVYAKQDIKAHYFIAQFTGKVKKTNVWKNTHCLSVQRKDGLWLTIKPGKDNKLQYLNHSKEPNAVFHNDRLSELYALRDIYEGEEITVNYDWEEPEDWDWSKMITPDESCDIEFAGFDLLHSARVADEVINSSDLNH